MAEALGFETDDRAPIYKKDHVWFPIPDFSTTWEGMGVLVEEALKQGVGFQLETRFMDGGFIDYSYLAASKRISRGVGQTAPYATCIAFLKAKGVAI